MKKAFTILTLATALTLVGYSVSNTEIKNDCIVYEQALENHFKSIEHKKALEILGYLESRNNYSVIKDFGIKDVYFGKYQIHVFTLKALGITVCKNKFKKDYNSVFNDSLQDYAVLQLMKANKHLLRKIFYKKVNTNICGIKVTEYGICAGAHLVGAGNMYKFLASNGKFIPRDGNNVPVTKYLSKFSSFTIKV